MEITDLEEQRIYSFIHGEMTADEEAAFKAELQDNADLRAKAALLARLSKAMKDVGTAQDHTLINALRASDRSSVERLSQPRPQQPAPTSHLWPAPTWLRWTAAAAATVLLVVGLRWGIERHHLTTLGQEYATVFTWTDEVRGELEPYEEELALLHQQIIQGQHLDAAICRLEALYGLSILDDGNDYTTFSFTIGWSLACGYLQQGERQAAIDQLERLNAHGYDKPICADKVQELLEKLR